LIAGTANAAGSCRQPSPPDIPADTPLGERAGKRLSRDMAEYVSDTTKFVACLRADGEQDSVTAAQQEYAALAAVQGQLNLYETRVGHSDDLIAEMTKLGGRTSRANLDRKIADAQRVYGSEAIQALNVAIGHFNAGRYAEARATVGELDLETLNPFERSHAERVLYTIAYAEENFEEAREHAQESIDAGGLSATETFRARVALADIDVMLRLSDTGLERAADQPAE
jgi:tetratricopeptide (TPR) repeat protein